MGKIKDPPKAKLITAVMVNAEFLFAEAQQRLQNLFGPVDLESPVYPFTFSDYYKAEMGKGLHKKLISFDRLIEKSELARIKIQTNEIEAQFTEGKGNRRRMNLDPGYVTDPKLVLASTKNFSHRIYIGQGIFAEVALQYHRTAGFEPLEWTYPDYRTDAIRAFLLTVRRRYMEQVRAV